MQVMDFNIIRAVFFKIPYQYRMPYARAKMEFQQLVAVQLDRIESGMIALPI
jgi:hypothetical protein